MEPGAKLPALPVSNSDLTLIPLASNVSGSRIRVSELLLLHTQPDSLTHVSCNYMYGRIFNCMVVNMMLMESCYLSGYLSAPVETSQ